MKTHFLSRTCFAFILSLGLVSSSLAQIPTPKEGYWVTETNLNQKKTTLVRYYNAQHELLHEQQIVGKTVNIRRPKTVKFLNSELMHVLNQPLLADRLKANQSRQHQ